MDIYVVSVNRRQESQSIPGTARVNVTKQFTNKNGIKVSVERESLIIVAFARVERREWNQ